MLKQPFSCIAFLVIAQGFTVSCVSVNIGAGKPTSAQGVSFTEPKGSFAPLSLKDADRAWQSNETGNTISYLSTCNDPTDPGLSTARRDYLTTLSDVKVLEENSSQFNGREALSTVAEGTVDGIATRLELLLFKKNNCLYSLSYVALANRFSQNHSQFREFVQSFKAP